MFYSPATHHSGKPHHGNLQPPTCKAKTDFFTASCRRIFPADFLSGFSAREQSRSFDKLLTVG
jgi:hypothetical protein